MPATLCEESKTGALLEEMQQRVLESSDVTEAGCARGSPAARRRLLRQIVTARRAAPAAKKAIEAAFS
jgi:hypothetical protein